MGIGGGDGGNLFGVGGGGGIESYGFKTCVLEAKREKNIRII